MIDPTTTEYPTDAGILRPFLGLKERRRSSSAKVTLGDDLKMATDALGAKSLSKHGVSIVVFSAHCLKVNRRDELKRRILVVSDVGVLLMDERTKRIRRKFAWKDLKCVRMSGWASSGQTDRASRPSCGSRQAAKPWMMGAVACAVIPA